MRWFGPQSCHVPPTHHVPPCRSPTPEPLLQLACSLAWISTVWGDQSCRIGQAFPEAPPPPALGASRHPRP